MPVLELLDVCLSFRRGRRHIVRVLDNASLALGAGEVVSVLAQRAQGKTTLLRTAAAMIKPDSGTILVDGEDVWALSDRRRSELLSRGVVMIVAAVPSLDASVLVNMALPLMHLYGQREAYAQARSALKRVGVAGCADQHWEDLADPERAFVALAHGIARQPKLLLVDDLTVSLGIEETDEVARMLATLATERGFGALMCVNDADATGWSSRIGTLGGGDLLMPAICNSHSSVINLPRRSDPGRAAEHR